MNNIIEFSPGHQRTRRPGSTPIRDAEILFFTGVRYERELDMAPSFVPDAMPLPDVAREACRELGLALDLAGHCS